MRKRDELFIHKQLFRPREGPFTPLKAGVWLAAMVKSGKPCLVHVLIYDLQVDYSSKQECANTLISLSPSLFLGLGSLLGVM